ncbi:DUF1840 domain-containing protein [Photobacterium atrarenae]|uniref:DUF1840 domain-containing protein n=1 Tax=Photobacterium atrarenae TaxID=865757 RepID=A0ABY5GLJ7_9GAMM|nr:DUF1840 domain-containing protein [Photobacterium atrarenae]UTV29984.1 DUF1840 domain-containing protein [Photobacterium atrarenae]
MLVTFHSKASGDIVMFGDIAKQMLKMMGQCENIPGVIEAEQVSDALAHLRQYIDRVHQLEQAAQECEEAASGTLPGDDELDEKNAEPVISMATRALPLVKMLEAAKKEQCFVMWE